MHLLYLGNVLSRYGYTPTTIETLSDRFSADFKVTNASNKKNKLLRLLDMWLHLFKFRSKVNLVMIDTYSSSAFLFAWTSARICEWLGLPYVAYLHGGDLPKRFTKSPKISQRYLVKAKAIVAPSGYLQNEVSQKFNLPVTCIPNYLDLSNYPFTLRKQIDSINLLWVRSFHEIYQPQVAIELVALLAKEALPTKLTMVGPDKDGSLEKCQILATKLGVEGIVTFTGRLTKEQWITLSADHNIFINTTSVDNTPVSVMEAMALGMPVVTTKVGGIPYLIKEGKEGIMVDEFTAETFRKAILELRQNNRLVESLSQNARTKAETWDWAVVRKMWLNLLSDPNLKG